MVQISVTDLAALKDPETLDRLLQPYVPDKGTRDLVASKIRLRINLIEADIAFGKIRQDAMTEIMSKPSVQQLLHNLRQSR